MSGLGKTVITSCFIELINGEIKIRREKLVFERDTEEEAEKRFDTFFEDQLDNLVWSSYQWHSEDFGEGSGDLAYNEKYKDLEPSAICPLD